MTRDLDMFFATIDRAIEIAGASAVAADATRGMCALAHRKLLGEGAYGERARALAKKFGEVATDYNQKNSLLRFAELTRDLQILRIVETWAELPGERAKTHWTWLQKNYLRTKALLGEAK